ncbi:putative oxidoreductase YvaA [Anaerohalosphaera lusitana]|uniref:Putative oxidoreductase YvaA n=1 Tax=Anaerohalosphaera lusitana TaxID=1936003 RepID=A0A1U9NNF6_9BACT|nr:Gfo/Idh/MocA family oxidoreductase [Anaerohalosphaera lusitana]AQT69274.1 putative oxidoreductase YvaA [Anaerohalosphaera lusitana]
MSDKMNRRDFMRSTAAVSAGLAIAPGLFAAEAKEKADDINVAILGAGSQGQVLLDSCLRIPGLRFKAVCDIWEQYNLRKVHRLLMKYRHENNAYIDYREMLDKEKDLDAVIIATPDFWHSEHAIACMEAGLDVYCEKEMSNTIEGAKKMVEAQKKTGQLLQIGHQRRSNPRYLYCKDKLMTNDEILGQVTMINGQWNRSARPDLSAPERYHIPQKVLKQYGFDSMRQFRNWRWYRGLGGGPIVDLGAHQIDVYNWFLGAHPKAVIANGGTDYYDKETHEWYDVVMAVYEYETKKGTVRAFYQTGTTNSNGGYYETFMGDKGTLTISEASSRGALYPENLADIKVAQKWEKFVSSGLVKEPVKEDTGGDEDALLDVRETVAPPAYEIPVTMEKKYHQPHLENFFDAMRGKVELNCPAEDGYASAVTVLKVNEAIQAKKRLEFKPEDFEA